MQTTEVAENKVATGLRVVLNGGKTEMDSATIPIQWFLSPELAEMRPTHILIVDRTETEVAIDMQNLGIQRGRRYTVKITDRVDFIQIFAPGRHRLTFVAIVDNEKSDSVSREMRKWLFEKGSSSFDNYLNTENDGAAAIRQGFNCMVAVSEVDVEIPEGLFATIGESRFAKWRYDWANCWYERKTPRDDCDYRKRQLLIPPKLLLAGFGWLIGWFFASLLTVFLPSARVVSLFLGYRPEPLFSNIRPLWTTPTNNWFETPKIVRRNKNGHKYEHLEWTNWADTKDGSTMRMLFAPWEASAVLLAVWFLWKALSGKALSGIDISSLLLVSLALFAITAIISIGSKMVDRFLSKYTWWHKFTDKLSAQFKKIGKSIFGRFKAPEQPLTPPIDQYRNWLMTELSEKRTPEKVDLEHLPKPFAKPLRQAIRIKFWATKAKVCKPFPNYRP